MSRCGNKERRQAQINTLKRKNEEYEQWLREEELINNLFKK